MDLPLPAAPPGGMLAGMQVGNALSKSSLENEMQQLINKYYGRNIESQMAYRNSLAKGQDITNQYSPDKLKLANTFQQLQNQYYPSNIQSEIASRNALANRNNTLTPLEAKEMELKNKYYPQVTEASIASQKALANYRDMGGPGGGVGQKQIIGLKRQILNENPNWSPEKVNLAASSYINGDDTLPDGTKIPSPSGIIRSMTDQIIKQGTTAPILTGNIIANQAEAELDVLNDYAQKGLAPYGDTYLNMSPQQVVDSFKTDDVSQKKLGKFIASQAIQYEAAQNRIRLAKGQPGVTSTEELMKLSGQSVNTKYPSLTYKARQEAARYLDEALRAGLKARQSVGIGASESRGKKNNNSKVATLRYNPEIGDYEEIK